MVAQPTTIQHTTVVAGTVLTLLADTNHIPVDADLEFHTRDPYAVRMVFTITGCPSVEWVFSRELLVAGLTGPAGMGDVQVLPVHDGILIELSSPGGSARLLVPPAELTTFVMDTLAAVPLGSEAEYFDLDTEIALLTGLDAPGRPLH